MDKEMLNQLKAWHDQSEYQKIIDVISEIPEGERDYDLTCQLARAHNNHENYKEALRLLLSVSKEGENDPLWHFRTGYAYYYLDEDEKAADCFERSTSLSSDDGDAWLFLAWSSRASGRRERFYAAVETLKERFPELYTEHFDPREQTSHMPEIYSEEELNAVEAHIEEHFGAYETVFHEIVSPDIHVDIAVIEPNEERNFYTLVTMGMGAHRMSIPNELAASAPDRAEIVACLPPDWNVKDGDERWYWPIRWLKILARLPGEQNTWLGWGHSVSNEGPFAGNTGLYGVILLDSYGIDGESGLCELPDGKAVRFYQMYPVYREEMDYKTETDTQSLLKLIGDRISPVIDPGRQNFCKSPKKFCKSQDEMEELLTDWEGPEGCIATDRITVDGCQAGFFYREEPYEDAPDSGWRFTAGDEDDDYMDNPDHSAIYSLNTICNYDPDIIEFLNAPVGTAFYRDADGNIMEDDTWEMEQEDEEPDGTDVEE